jgi:hypothetical protein
VSGGQTVTTLLVAMVAMVLTAFSYGRMNDPGYVEKGSLDIGKIVECRMQSLYQVNLQAAEYTGKEADNDGGQQDIPPGIFHLL